MIRFSHEANSWQRCVSTIDGIPQSWLNITANEARHEARYSEIVIY